MSKLTKQNVAGTDYTMVGCTLTGVCASSASDYVKVVTLSDGDEVSDGMIVACTFANENTAGIAPASTIIYSSDQINYYSDSGLTQPFTLAPSGCCTIEYTGTGNAYTYTSYPVIQIGNITGPLCAPDGSITGGTLWHSGATVMLHYTGGKFLLLNVFTEYFSKNTVFLDTNADLNDLKTAGIYCTNDVDTLQNKPIASANNNLIFVYQNGTNVPRYTQIFVSINADAVWYRFFQGGWSSWQQFARVDYAQPKILTSEFTATPTAYPHNFAIACTGIVKVEFSKYVSGNAVAYLTAYINGSSHTVNILEKDSDTALSYDSSGDRFILSAYFEAGQVKITTATTLSGEVTFFAFI